MCGANNSVPGSIPVRINAATQMRNTYLLQLSLYSFQSPRKRSGDMSFTKTNCFKLTLFSCIFMYFLNEELIAFSCSCQNKMD